MKEKKYPVDTHKLTRAVDRKIRPPLKKSLFPVQRVPKIKTSREAGISFFFLDIFFIS